MDDMIALNEQHRADLELGRLADAAAMAIAGRRTAAPDMGKVPLIDLKDASGRLQVSEQKQALGA